MFCLNLKNDRQKTTGTIGGIASMLVLSLSLFKLSFSTRSKIFRMKKINPNEAIEE
jgi:hypothetical protein